MFRMQNLTWYIHVMINQCFGLKPLCATFYVYLCSPWNSNVGIVVKHIYGKNELISTLYISFSFCHDIIFSKCKLYDWLLVNAKWNAFQLYLQYDTPLCDKVCQWLAAGRRFPPGTPVSCTNNTDRHDIAELLLEVALNSISLTLIYRTKTILQIMN